MPPGAAAVSDALITDIPALVPFLEVATALQVAAPPNTLGRDGINGDTEALTDAAIKKCMAARKLEGPLSSTAWTKKAFAVLAASVELVRAFADDPGALDKTRRTLKEDDGRRRALNKDNVALVAVHLCHTKGDPKQTKELSRFSVVVALAVHQNVCAADAESWLRKRTLTEAIEEGRTLKRGSKPAHKRSENPIRVGKYPALFEVLSTAGHKDREAISARIGVFMDELERELHCAADPSPADVAADTAVQKLMGGGNV